jgi:hypothetical protein
LVRPDFCGWSALVPIALLIYENGIVSVNTTEPYTLLVNGKKYAIAKGNQSQIIEKKSVD